MWYMNKATTVQMVERWEGIIRASCNGCKNLTRVMASLLVSPQSGKLLKPSRNAIIFMGDDCSGTGDPNVERFCQLENIASILVSKLGPSVVNVWVVEAPRFSGPFACYDGFLQSMSAQGEPLGYDPRGLPALKAITILVGNCLNEVSKQLPFVTDSSAEQTKERHDYNDDVSVPKTLFFGFSKGGVVLNQLLSEIAYVHEQGMTAIQNLQSSPQQEGGNSNVVSTSIPELLENIVAIHYIDVGLNCRGAYQTDISVLENVVKAASSSGLELHLGFHGTPRQWKDRRRSWIATEKDRCVSSLKMIAEKVGYSKVQVTEKLYFQNEKPSLYMHFKILDILELD